LFFFKFISIKTKEMNTDYLEFDYRANGWNPMENVQEPLKDVYKCSQKVSHYNEVILKVNLLDR